MISIWFHDLSLISDVNLGYNRFYYHCNYDTLNDNAVLAANISATDYSGFEKDVTGLGINDIASVTFKLNKPIFYDQFKNHRTNGSFILIDPQSNNTVGAGFIQ